MLDPVALNGQPPSYILKISSPPNGRLTSERFNSVGSVLVIAELRPEGGRYFVSRVLSWTYPDSEHLYGMNGSTSITTVTFEPDGTGTFCQTRGYSSPSSYWTRMRGKESRVHPTI